MHAQFLLPFLVAGILAMPMPSPEGLSLAQGHSLGHLEARSGRSSATPIQMATDGRYYAGQWVPQLNHDDYAARKPKNTAGEAWKRPGYQSPPRIRPGYESGGVLSPHPQEHQGQSSTPAPDRARSYVGSGPAVGRSASFGGYDAPYTPPPGPPSFAYPSRLDWGKTDKTASWQYASTGEGHNRNAYTIYSQRDHKIASEKRSANVRAGMRRQPQGTSPDGVAEDLYVRAPRSLKEEPKARHGRRAVDDGSNVQSKEAHAEPKGSPSKKRLPPVIYTLGRPAAYVDQPFNKDEPYSGQANMYRIIDGKPVPPFSAPDINDYPQGSRQRYAQTETLQESAPASASIKHPVEKHITVHQPESPGRRTNRPSSEEHNSPATNLKRSNAGWAKIPEQPRPTQEELAAAYFHGRPSDSLPKTHDRPAQSQQKEIGAYFVGRPENQPRHMPKEKTHATSGEHNSPAKVTKRTITTPAATQNNPESAPTRNEAQPPGFFVGRPLHADIPGTRYHLYPDGEKVPYVAPKEPKSPQKTSQMPASQNPHDKMPNGRYVGRPAGYMGNPEPRGNLYLYEKGQLVEQKSHRGEPKSPKESGSKHAPYFVGNPIDVEPPAGHSKGRYILEDDDFNPYVPLKQSSPQRNT
ncbi:hypothetical protein PspLS_10042 [Pyricularia sp. CBS 133598]|nr:hypothetical protein PspLS_10042 [Pyricularia sp. CBS 133598]